MWFNSVQLALLFLFFERLLLALSKAKEQSFKALICDGDAFNNLMLYLQIRWWYKVLWMHASSYSYEGGCEDECRDGARNFCLEGQVATLIYLSRQLHIHLVRF